MKEFTAYIESLKMGNKSEHTIRAYSKDIQKFINFFNIETKEDLNKLTESDFFSFYSSTGLKDKSLNALIRNLSAFFSWLKMPKTFAFYGVLFGGKIFVDEKKKVHTILTDEEIIRMIKAANDIQTKFMISLISFTAIRRDEAARIKLSDISGCEILIRGKGDVESIVYMDEILCNMLQMYLAVRESDSPFLFFGTRGESNSSAEHGVSGETINNRIKKAAHDAGIDEIKLKNIHAHVLRGSAATKVIAEYGVGAAKLLLRHSNISTTERYNGNGSEFVRQLALKRSMSNKG